MSPVRRVAGAVLLGFLPVLVTLSIASWMFGASSWRSVPYVGDEVSYWVQVAGFETAGFDSGYFIVNEQPSRVAFSHFGPHGPAYAVLFGGIARIAGWEYWSAPIVSAAFLVAGIAAWVFVARPSLPVAALLFATFWPLVLALPNTMEESLHGAFACAIAAAVVAVLGQDRRTRWQPVAGLFALLTIASLIRPMWALLALPLGGYVAHDRDRKAWAGVALGIAFVAVTYGVYMLLASPYGDVSGGLVERLTNAPLLTVAMSIRRLGSHLEEWLAWRGEWLEIVFRYELMGLGLAAAGLAAFGRRAPGRSLLVFVAVTAGLLLLAALAVLNPGSWRDYRTITPVVLLLWLVAGSARPRLLWIAVAVHVLLAPIAVATFAEFHGPRFERDLRPDIDAFASQAQGTLTFDRSLSPWGNSVLMHAEVYQYPLLGLPRGIGASSVLDWESVAMPLRSRYLLLRPVDVEALAARVNMRKLKETSLGVLYENLDWQR